MFLLLLGACGGQTTVTLVTHSESLLVASDVASWDLWVLASRDIMGAEIRCEVFTYASPISTDFSILIPPVRGERIEHGAQIAVQAIPPSDEPRLFVMRFFTEPDQLGLMNGYACTTKVLPPGGHVDIEVLATSPN